MENGKIEISRKELDLLETLQSGQTFCWRRLSNRPFFAEDSFPTDWYGATVADGIPTMVRQLKNGTVEWKASSNVEEHIRQRFRLEESLSNILATFPQHSRLEEAVERRSGLRLVRDPFVQTLISFITAQQMGIERVFELQKKLCQSYGEESSIGEKSFYQFPELTQLSASTEKQLKELGFGYRSSYIAGTIERLLNTSRPPNGTYSAVHDTLQEYIGVGNKVADCVALYSLGYLEAIPIDTRIRSVVEKHFPECQAKSYDRMSSKLRKKLGEYPGYVQLYLYVMEESYKEK